MIGYHDTNTIVSISNDGKMCQWKSRDIKDAREFSMLQVGKNLMAQEGEVQAPEQTQIGA